VRGRWPGPIGLCLAVVSIAGLALVPEHAGAWPTRGRQPASLRGLHRPEQSWDFLPVQAAGRHFRVLAFDGHTHSDFSRDAIHPIAELMWLAERVDLDMIVLTDHGSSAARRYFEHGYDGPVAVLVGEEVGGSFGHAVIWDIDSHDGIAEACATSMDALGELVHGQGGTVVLAHPGWWIGRNTYDPRRWIQYDALRRGGIGQRIDALELWNQVYWERSRELIDEWVGLLERGLYVPIVGDSDFHRAYSHRLGEPRNALLCTAGADGALTQSPADCLREAVRSGRLYVTDGPTLDLQVAGRVPGEVVEALPGTLLAVELRARSAEGGTLRLFVGRDVAATVPMPAGTEVTHTITVPVPAADSFVRVEIERLEVPDDRPSFSLVSNPVRIDVLPRRTDGWRGPDEGSIPGPTGFSRAEVDRAAQAIAQRRVDLRPRRPVGSLPRP